MESRLGITVSTSRSTTGATVLRRRSRPSVPQALNANVDTQSTPRACGLSRTQIRHVRGNRVTSSSPAQTPHLQTLRPHQASQNRGLLQSRNQPQNPNRNQTPDQPHHTAHLLNLLLLNHHTALHLCLPRFHDHHRARNHKSHLKVSLNHQETQHGRMSRMVSTPWSRMVTFHLHSGSSQASGSNRSGLSFLIHTTTTRHNINHQHHSTNAHCILRRSTTQTRRSFGLDVHLLQSRSHTLPMS